MDHSDQEIELCKKMDLALPTIEPRERLRKMMATRNEWKLYKRTCDSTGKEMLSAYPPNSPFKVYQNSIWWGDTWNAIDYGRDYDFNKTFFEQYAELQKVVPREGTTVFNSENCDYNSHIRESKNCFLNSLVAKCENLYYSYWMVSDKDVYDSAYTNNSTLCYECVDVENGYECVMLQESSNCNNCYFSYQLRGCNNCLFSSNLVNKTYYLFNKPCTKEEFEEAKKKVLNGSWTSWKEAESRFEEMKAASFRRATHTLKCENSTGDHIYTSKNCANCYDTHESEDCYNSISADHSKDIHNCYSAGWPGCEMIFECCVTRGSNNCAYCTYTWFSNSLRYCDSCVSSENCFGCIGLRHKKYCILNKEYTKEEYESLVPKIIEKMQEIGEWGEFFPASLSPFAYNETAAQDFFPSKKEEVETLGWRWREVDKKEYQPATIAEIPDNIKDLPESITKEVLACENCKKNYRLIPQEIAFYKSTGLPAPRICGECRNSKRFKARNPYELFARTCAHCHKSIQSTYAPNRPEIVYCDECYLEAVD